MMLTRIRKAMKERDQGFTLIELLVVIIIIGILAAIAIPVFLNQRKKGVDASLKQDLRAMAIAQETFITSNPSLSGLNTAATTAGGTASVNGINDFQASPGNVVDANLANNGYCIIAKSAGGTVATWMAYDSLRGGNIGFLTATAVVGGACAGTTSTT